MLDPMMTNNGPCQCPQNVWGNVPTGTILAVFKGNVQPYRDWLTQGGNVNDGLACGFTFIYAAAAGGQEDILREILEHPNIHLNITSNYASTALIAAARWGKAKCIEILLSTKPKEVMTSVFRGNTHSYKDWIDKGGDVTDCCQMGFDFFYMACVGGHPHILREILAHPNVHLNKVGKWGNTGLASAARWGYKECVKILMTTCPRSNCRLDITAKDSEGLTALAMAAQYNRWHILPYLIIPRVEYDQKNLDVALRETTKGKQWDLVVDLLQTYQGFYSESLSHTLFKATEAREVKILRLILDYHYAQCDTKILESVRMWASKMGYEDAEILITRALDGYYDIPISLKSKTSYNNNDLYVDRGGSEKFLRHTLSLPRPIGIPSSKTFDGRPLPGDSAPSLSPVLQQAYEGIFLVTESPHSISPQFSRMPQTGRLQLNVIPVQTPVPPGPEVYDTTSTPRGIVLILNYNKFKDRPDMLREGSYLDVLNMRELCDQMGYETQVHYNLTGDQTLATLDTFRNQIRLGRVSCILVVIMSHGISRHTFYTSDMNTVTVNEVQSLFLDNQCPLLKNKPKLFLFNFCRGSDIPASLETDAVREQPRNILCIYSTTESFLSYRDKNKGCPFIVALCEVIANHAHEMDLDNLIRKFQQKYLPNTTPEIQNLGFYKKFFFNPTRPQNRERFYM